MNLTPIDQRLIAKRIVPVAVLESVDDALPLAYCLAEAGIEVIEVTLRTPRALDCIRAIREERPEMLVGAGTILQPDQIQAAIAAGAQFGVSPGLNEDVVRAARAQGLFFVPGIMTPSEVERALALDCRLQKFFPAEAAGGVKMLKSLAGPYQHCGVRFVPLGGVSAANLAEYLAVPVVAAVGGTWLCERKLIQEKRWTEISALAQSAVAQVSAISVPKS
jgi:2-dehydro-3-deoxyphosphogluconate aldolase / (4S)-4-hydroxy-2-oxoglutarate aldolase